MAVSENSSPEGRREESISDTHSRRLDRLDRTIVVLQMGLVVVAVLAMSAVAVIAWLLPRRAGVSRADVMVARRFVVEHEGQRRAQFGMDSLGHWSQLLLGPGGANYGIAIGEMGQLHVRTPEGATSINGAGVSVGDSRAAPRAGFGLYSRSRVWWLFGYAGDSLLVVRSDKRADRTFIDSLISSSHRPGVSFPP